MTTQKTALVLGATGGIGGEVARTLHARGWHVRALHRNPGPTPRRRFDWRRGDAMSPADVTAAAEGAALIVHAVNPPGYRNWAELVLPMLDSTIAAARAARRHHPAARHRLQLRPRRLPVLTEDSPQHPAHPQGRDPRRHGGAAARRRRRPAPGCWWCAPATSSARAPATTGSRRAWSSRGSAPRAITAPGAPGVGHQWAYLPDVAETMVRLVEADRPEPFATYHMAGHWDPDGTAMIAAIRAALGAPICRSAASPGRWCASRSPSCRSSASSPRCATSGRQPIRMDNRRLVAAIGPEPHTPLAQAVRATLAGLGCLPGIAGGGRRSSRPARSRDRAGRAGLATLGAPHQTGTSRNKSPGEMPA